MATVITKVETLGDFAHVAGTVNGTPVDAYGWVSATAGMTKPQKIAYAQALLNAQAPQTFNDVTAQFQ